MKKILVPTDFSPTANNACKYAIEIAKAFRSDLYLYHVYFINKVDYNLGYSEEEQPYKKLIEGRMNRTKQKYLSQIEQEGLSLHTIVEQDNIYALFKRKVKKHGIDLIVMGSKGAAGLKKVILGSVAAAALEMTIVPVLIVPPEQSFSTLKHIVLAFDNNDISLDVLSPLQKLAIKFGAKVTLLNVNTGSSNNMYQETNLKLEGVETTYHEVLMSNSINESIDEYINQVGCELLCMVRREKGFLRRFIQKSITKTQAYNSKIPLMVLPEK